VLPTGSSEFSQHGWWWLRRALSSVRVGPYGVRVRNFPGLRRTYAHGTVDRFDWRHEELREVGVLLLTSGKAVEVCALDERRPGSVANLNNLLRSTRPGAPDEDH